MADFTVSGLSEQMEELLRLGQVPDEVKAEILTAGGTVLKEEQAKVAREMGIYDRDNDSKHAVDSIGLTKVNKNDTPDGKDYQNFQAALTLGYKFKL